MYILIHLFFVFIALFFGALIGRLIGIFSLELPHFLLSDDPHAKTPRSILGDFFKTYECRSCKKSYSYFQNFPVIGYLALKGQCPHCSKKTDSYYFFLELGMSLLYGFTVLLFSINAPVIMVFLVSSLLVACFITDYEHGILPDQFTLSLLWIGLLGSLIPLFITPNEAIIGAFLGYTLFWGINELFLYLRNRIGMYPGDFKLNAGLGACFGIKWLLPVLILSLILVVLVAIVRLIGMRKMPTATDMHQEIAYSCYVSIVAIAALYYRLFLTI